MEKEVLIRCNNCYSIYTENELKQFCIDDEYFLGCENCESDNYLMTLEKDK